MDAAPPLDTEVCYRAGKSRDARFDGRFFTAVLTTGIYCRPICPARTPLRKNVRYFLCAAAAEEAGFRPCRCCRPETAPGTPSWLGASALVSRAMRLIEGGALDEHGVEALAERLGVGDRHLRGLFAKHLGTSPRSVAMSRRAHFARTMLDTTSLPVAEVAFASGFQSVRQFNRVISQVFARSPTQLRKRHARRAEGDDVEMRLSFRPPLAWEHLLGFLSARAIPGVEQVADGRYRRTFAAGAAGGILTVSLGEDRRGLKLSVRGALPVGLLDLVRRARRLFDLDADPMAITDALRTSRVLAPGCEALPGLRVPGAWDTFEILVRAILGQQISVRAATTFAGRLVERFGQPLGLEGPLTHLFPTPKVLATANLTEVGLTAARACALNAIAAAVTRSDSWLAPGSTLEELVERLRGLPGVGPWTAHYVAMRAFSEPDAFPAGDLGLRRACGNCSEAQLEARAGDWRPWRAYAAMYLWHLDSERMSHANRIHAV